MIFLYGMWYGFNFIVLHVDIHICQHSLKGLFYSYWLILALFILKLYFIDYAITVVPIFPLSPPTTQPPPHLRNPHAIVHVHGSWVKVHWLLHFLYCTLSTHGYSVTMFLYFLIPLPPHPLSPDTPFPSGNHQNALLIHDSVYVPRVCLVCFLDSIVDRYV